MPVRVKVKTGSDILHFVASGVVETMEDLLSYLGVVKTHLLRHDVRIRRVLLDERAMEDLIDALDAYQFSESDMAALAAMNGVRIACLSSPASYEFNLLFETFLRNRSLNFKAFLDIEEAEAWLMA